MITLRCTGEVDADSAIVAADPLCQQALECQAEDMAIEDTLYALERALTDGHLPSDTYLKQVVPCLVAFCCSHATLTSLMGTPCGRMWAAKAADVLYVAWSSVAMLFCGVVTPCSICAISMS